MVRRRRKWKWNEVILRLTIKQFRATSSLFWYYFAVLSCSSALCLPSFLILRLFQSCESFFFPLSAWTTLFLSFRFFALRYWELETFPEEARLGVTIYDEIWTATDYCARAFRRSAPRSPIPVRLTVIYDMKLGGREKGDFRFGVCRGEMVSGGREGRNGMKWTKWAKQSFFFSFSFLFRFFSVFLFHRCHSHFLLQTPHVSLGFFFFSTFFLIFGSSLPLHQVVRSCIALLLEDDNLQPRFDHSEEKKAKSNEDDSKNNNNNNSNENNNNNNNSQSNNNGTLKWRNTIPLTRPQTPTPKFSREHFHLRSEDFIFYFNWDYGSLADRKNPKGRKTDRK